MTRSTASHRVSNASLATTRATPQNGAIRPDVVARARRLLAEGYYDNTYVLHVAVARLIRCASGAPRTGAAPGRSARESVLGAPGASGGCCTPTSPASGDAHTSAASSRSGRAGAAAR